MTELQGLPELPITDIDPLGRQIDEMLAACMAQREALYAAGQEPSSFDAYTLAGLTARLTVQRDNLWRIDEQLRRWLTAELTDEKRPQVQRLGEQMVRLYDVIDATLQLASELERSIAATLSKTRRDAAKAVTPRKRRSANRSREDEQL